MANILITGSGSFIGRNFIRSSVHKSVKEVSLRDRNPRDIEFKGYNVILHLAAIISRPGKVDANDCFRVNRDLCIEVAENAKKAGVGQFIFLSTVKVYGKFKNHSEFWDESSECEPDDLYGKSKLEAEIALRKLESPGFIVSIVRTPVVYGEGVKGNILGLIRLVERFNVLPLAGINNLRNYTFVENLVAFLDRIIERRASGTFIVMDDKPISTTDLVKYIATGLGKKITLIKLPYFMVKIGMCTFPQYFNRLFGSILLNNTKTKTELEFNPPFDIETGLHKMMINYRKVTGDF